MDPNGTVLKMLKPLAPCGSRYLFGHGPFHRAVDIVDCRWCLEDLVFSAREIQEILQFTIHADLLNFLVHGDGTCTLLIPLARHF